METKIRGIKAALLIMHSPLDKIVGIENASYIFKLAKHPKSFVSLDTADHLLTDAKDAKYVGEVISSWSKRYLVDGSLPKPEEYFKVSVVNDKYSYTSYIRAGKHVQVADEPESLGGSDLGPDPYSYLLSSLGSCTCMTLRMYARKKGWPLDRVEVLLSHKKIHVSDCEKCDTKEEKVDYIERKIRLLGTLSEDQKSRLIEIAERCPVHRTLNSKIVVRTTLD